MNGANELRSLWLDVQRVLETVSEPLVASGRADLRGAPDDGYELIPANGESCPVTVYVQSEHEVSLFLGAYGTTVDIWDRDRGRVLERLRAYVEAVVDGRYEERVRLSRSEPDRLGKAKVIFHLAGRDATHTYSCVPTVGDRAPWRHLTYAPY